MRISEQITGCKTIGIAGHVKPDGDCIGSCLALYQYITVNFPDIAVDVYLMPFPEKYQILSGAENVYTTQERDIHYDLFIAVDSSDLDRLGPNRKYFDHAARTLCIDHHISNLNYADENIVVPDASSTCEVIFSLLEEEKINTACAEALYVGIVSDTGVFRHSCTGSNTYYVAGRLLEKGIDGATLVRKTFSERTFAQTRIMGEAMLDSRIDADTSCIISVVSKAAMDRYEVLPEDLDGIVDQLIAVDEAECALFMYEIQENVYKISLRSKTTLDVSQVALSFGGGGHVRAAGCTIEGAKEAVSAKVLAQIKQQEKA